MNQSDIKAKIDELAPWWHYHKLPNGMEIQRDDAIWKEAKDYPENAWKRQEPFFTEDLKGKEVLDIGCNSGWYSMKLAQMGAKVTGIDIHQDSPTFCDAIDHIAQCNFLADIVLTKEQRKNTNFIFGDFRDLPQDEQYDAIVFFGVYYHLTPHETAIPIINGQLKKGGILYLESATEEKSRYLPKGHAGDNTNAFVPSLKYLENDLTNNGFEILGEVGRPADLAGYRQFIKARKL